MSLSHATGNHWRKAPFAYLDLGTTEIPENGELHWWDATCLWIYGRGTVNPCGDYCEVDTAGFITYIEPAAYSPAQLRGEHPRIHMDDFVAIGL